MDGELGGVEREIVEGEGFQPLGGYEGLRLPFLSKEW